jgi:hypothetical protein
VKLPPVGVIVTDRSTGIIVGLTGVVCVTATVTEVGTVPAVNVMRVFGPSKAYGVDNTNDWVRVTVPKIRALPPRDVVIVTDFAPVCIVPFVIVKVPTFRLLFNVIAVAESTLLTVRLLNVVAPLAAVGGTPPNSTVDEPALKLPLFVQFPKRTTLAEPPAPVALLLIVRLPFTLSVPTKVLAEAFPFLNTRSL